VDGTFPEFTQSGNVTLTNVGQSDIPFYVVGGSVITLQPSNQSLTTAVLRRKPFKILVALDKNNSAIGNFFLDNGVDLNIGANALIVNYTATGTQLTATVVKNTLNGTQPNINAITILGLGNGTNVNSVTVNVGGSTQRGSPRVTNGQLDITGLSIPVTSSFTVQYGGGGTSGTTTGAAGTLSYRKKVNLLKTFNGKN